MSAALESRSPFGAGETDDASLLARIAAGESKPLGVLFDRYAESMRRVILRLGVRPGEVDDLVQITFLDVLRVAASYDGRPCAKPWLLALATMRVRRHRRSFARLADRLARFGREPEVAPETPEHAAGTSREAARAARAVEQLSDKKREVFLLVALEGLTCEEVAEHLQIPVGTVWTRLHHARAELRQSLEKETP